MARNARVRFCKHQRIIQVTGKEGIAAVISGMYFLFSWYFMVDMITFLNKITASYITMSEAIMHNFVSICINSQDNIISTTCTETEYETT